MILSGGVMRREMGRRMLLLLLHLRRSLLLLLHRFVLLLLLRLSLRLVRSRGRCARSSHILHALRISSSK